MEQPAFDDTPTTRCNFYRRVCGLPAVVHPPSGRITVSAGSVWGISMSATLGQAVRDELQRRQLALGPIVSHPRSRTWTFLVKADVPDSAALFGQLFRAHVAVHRTGCQIGLPSPADPPLALRYWIEPPRDQFRPSGSVVVSVVSQCLPSGAIDLRMLDHDAGWAAP